MTPELLDAHFSYHLPTADTSPRYAAIRAAEQACHDVVTAHLSQIGVGVADYDRVNAITRAFAAAIVAHAPASADTTAAYRSVRLARNAMNEWVAARLAKAPETIGLVDEARRQLVLARWQACAAIACAPFEPIPPPRPPAANPYASLLPCWGKHQRMGHGVVVGEFRWLAGNTAEVTVPASPAGRDEDGCLRASTPARRFVVPMDGPAFYGFEVLDEAAVLDLVLAARRYDFTADPVATPPALHLEGTGGRGLSDDDDKA